MKKNILLFCVLMFAFVVNVSALSSSISCSPDDGIINDTITCQVTITPGEVELIKSFKTNIEYSTTDFDLLSITPAEGWTSNSTTSIDLSNSNYGEEEGLTDPLMIATLRFKIKSTTTFDSKNLGLNGTDLSSSVSDTVFIKSTNNLLSNLSIVGKDFSFNPSTNTYNITGFTLSTVTIRATLQDTRAHFDDSKKPGIYELNYGDNTIQIIVISESGKSNVYTININRIDERSTNNSLSSLGVSTGTMNPSFSKNNLVYDVSVPANTENIIVTAALADKKSSFVSGYGPRTVELKTGINSVLIQVKSEKGDVKTYTVNITRSDKKSNNYLKSIKLSSGKIEFKKETTEYKLNVENETEKMEITASAEDLSAKVEIIGNKALTVGENKYEIKVTAENGSVRLYKINVTRLEKGKELSTNNYLKELVVKGYKLSFDKDVLNYNLTIKSESKLTFSYIPEDETAVVKVVGNSGLKNNSKIDIVVTSEKGTTKTYTINIKKTIDWALIGMIFGGLALLGGIVAVIVFKDKIFKTKEREIKSDVLKDSKLVLGNSKKEVEKPEVKELKEIIKEKEEIKEEKEKDETKVFKVKPELTVIPDVPGEEIDDSELYLEDIDKKK